MRTFRKLRGFTLVELMIVVAIIGVLAALAIYGVTRYLRNSKTAEARAGVGAIAKGNVSFYNGEVGVTSVIPVGTSAAFSQNICITGKAGAGIPVALAAIKGKKYQSTEADWRETAGLQGTGFPCLKFSMDQPQYFQYQYVSNAAANTSPVGKAFTAFAHGDLNGDSTTSTFSLTGAVGAAGDNRVLLAPAIAEIDPIE